MRARTVQAPDGRHWVVRRHWTRWRLGVIRADGGGILKRIRQRLGWSGRGAKASFDVLEAAEIGQLGEIPVIGVVFLAIGMVILVVGAAMLAALVVVPLLLAVVDLVVLLAIVVAGVVVRVVFRRPCLIEAEASDGTRLTWTVVGWRASRRRRDEVAELLAAGVTPPGAEVVTPPPPPPSAPKASPSSLAPPYGVSVDGPG